MTTSLHLGFKCKFTDLYDRKGLTKIDAAFLEQLKVGHSGLYRQLLLARSKENHLEAKEASDLIIDLAPHLEDFIASLFAIETEVAALQDQHTNLAPLYRCKRLFVQRKSASLTKGLDVTTVDGATLRDELAKLFGEDFTELVYATFINDWMEKENEPALIKAATYARWALEHEEGIAYHQLGILFKKPKKLDFAHLVELEEVEIDGVRTYMMPKNRLHHRHGFGLLDHGGSLEMILDEANYCIYCHNQGKDSCSKGLKDKDGNFKKSPTNVTLNGCPLEEHISEMNSLKAHGYTIGALATIAINNPLCAATGHRICNDCMKSCIYQKQAPVNIPQVETKCLKDTLSLPYGFEIYSLLTRWNPLNFERPLPKENSGYKILVAGLGPAGFNLAHHLMNDGHTVVGIDGLKIEPLDPKISGIKMDGTRSAFTPIKDIESIKEPLDTRSQAGFGGVAEYGITVRWDKNFLKIVRLLLERRAHFRMYGGVFFDNTITYEEAFNLGFDHISLCLGAGKPTVIPIKNALARGVRAASDFLMALQLTGAAKEDSIANLQLRLPVVVIGGGLTGIDTTTESLAYYPLQVEKFLQRYETLCAKNGEDHVRGSWSAEELAIAEEFITHAKAIRSERKLATEEGRKANIIGLLQSWGGATLVYRRHLTDAPSYRLNHEEVDKAMQEGIFFVEDASPLSIEVDDYQHAKGLKVKLGTEDKEILLPAKSIFMAAGTSPNVTFQNENDDQFSLDGKYFQALDEENSPITPEWIAKPETPQIKMFETDDGREMSFLGDLHPSYAGNVVKAMGSAKQAYPIISKRLQKQKPMLKETHDRFFSMLDDELLAVVHAVNRLTPTIVEVVVKAPAAARHFRPGQFYRLQNFEPYALQLTGSKELAETTLAMEGLALTGASADPDSGLLSTIVLEMGGSSDLCAYLQKDEPIILMGPTGLPTHIPHNETVLLCGGGLGNAVLFSIGKALKASGCRVLYFAGYKNVIDRYKVEEIEAASDVIVWCCDEDHFKRHRPQDFHFHGNIVDAMVEYAKGNLGETPIGLDEVDRLIVIGSDRMMAAVAASRHSLLKPYLKADHIAIGSINSPMQCMMKAICAQCLQQHTDEKGNIRYVFSCVNQDQLLDEVNFPHLNERLKQNTTQEKLTKQWIDLCLKQLQLRKIAA